jgi:hypothetical protein
MAVFFHCAGFIHLNVMSWPSAAGSLVAISGKVAAVCTYGASRTITFLLGDPPKRVVKRLVRWMPGHHIRCDYPAYYGMDHSGEKQRAAFLKKVRRTISEPRGYRIRQSGPEIG